MFAIECSNPQSTNIITGKNIAAIFPVTDSAEKAIHTAMQTRKLQSTPRIKASPKPMLTFAFAVATTVSEMLSNTPESTTRSVTKSAPSKLPRNTNPQFFSSLEKPILPESRAIHIKQLPVKSSLPANTTITRPAGKIHAPASLPTYAFPKVAATHASAINAPAIAPSRIIL